MLEIKNLRVSFGNIVAVDHFDMTVSPNTIHSLIGPNGAGKTTVFNAIFNFVPYSGKITFLNHDLGRMPQYERVTLGLTRTFQNLSLFYSMNVEENVKMGLFPFLKSNVFKDFLGFDVFNTKEVNERVKEVLELVNIAPLAEAYPVFLPHGTQDMCFDEICERHCGRLRFGNINEWLGKPRSGFRIVITALNPS